QSFLERAPSSLRVGIVSFSDEAQVIVPPTVDRKQLEQGIDVLGPGFGTALGDGIARAVELARAVAGKTGDGAAAAGAPLKDAKGRSLASILLLSDGAQTRGLLSPGQGAARAQQAGIPVYTIALGTDGGTILAGPPGRRSARSPSTRGPSPSTRRAPARSRRCTPASDHASVARTVRAR